jgi:gliding motility-associated-like protein
LIVTNSNGCADTLTQLVHSIDQSPDFSANKLAICHRDSVVFTAFNYDPSLTPILDWDFGDGNTATVNTPTVTHSYIASGTYTVLLVITDINGCKDSVTKTNYIRVNGPTAAFATTDSTGCTGILTTFNDLSTTDGINTIVNWHWDFGDGTIQDFTGPPYQHIYNAVGVFPVSLKVTDNSGCTDSIALNNLITRTDPTPDFNASQFNCPGSAFTFINVSTPGGFSSNWDFGDGGTSTVTSPVYAYTAPGVYDIKLKIVDTNGCADSLTKTQYITVDVPKADFIPSDTTGSCIPLEIRFTNTSTYYNSLIWDFGPGEGTSIQNDPVHYYATPGIYPVKLVITSPGGCMDSIIKTITVYDTSGARANYVPLAGCKPLIVNLDMFTPGTMASYLWDFGDGNTDTTTTSTNTHVYTSYGNFLPKVIMEDPSGCIIPIAGLDTIIVIGANAKFGYDDSLFCDRGPVNFTDSTTFNDPIVNHSWLFGDGGSSSIQNPSHQYLAPGNYDVSLAILTQNGCRDTITKLNAIKVVQSPLTFIGGDSVICLGQPLLHTGLFLLPDTSQVGWSWNFPNGHTSSFQNPSPQIYISAGTFTVTSMAVNSSGCRDTATKTIYVNPLPVVNMPGQLTVQNGFPVTIPATYSPNTMSWQWSPTQGLSCTNCPTPDAGPKFNTTYIVNFTDNNGCVNNATLEVIVICKNANLFIPNTFSPNGDGSNDRFYPRGKGLERVRSLRIFNRWGEVVFEKREFPVNDPLSGWDGTFKGKKPQADVYVYQVEVFCENGEIIRLNGNIALIL